MSEIELVKCPYCGGMSEDIEFCDLCGRSMSIEQEPDEAGDAKVSVRKTKWLEKVLPCYAVESEFSPNEEGFLSIPGLIEMPIKWEKGEYLYTLFFIKGEEKDIATWITEKEIISFEDVIKVIRRLQYIISEINKSKYILGSLDLSDLWIKDDDIGTLYLRQVRPFLTSKNPVTTVKHGEIFSPEIKNGDTKCIGYGADVFLIGKVFLHLILKDKDLMDYGEFRYLSHQISLLNPSVPHDMHHWICKSTSMFTEDRYKDTAEQLESLEKVLQKYEQRMCSQKVSRIYSHYEKSDAGKGKSIDAPLDKRETLNEDSFLFLWDDESDKSKAFSLVADGISTCKYGSGYKASRIITDKAASLWREQHGELTEIESVKKFFEDILLTASTCILNEAVKDIPLNEDGEPLEYVYSSDIMGSTFAAALLDGNKAYIASLGDSRIYRWSRDRGISLLTIDHNYMNQCIEKGISWDEIKCLDNKSSLTKFVGGADTNSWPFKELSIDIEVKEVMLLEDEMLILCSDGLTDYLNPIGHRSDQWNSDMKIHQILCEEVSVEHSLKEIADRFVDEANKNGGGDNITLILIRPENT